MNLSNWWYSLGFRDPNFVGEGPLLTGKDRAGILLAQLLALKGIGLCSSSPKPKTPLAAKDGLAEAKAIAKLLSEGGGRDAIYLRLSIDKFYINVVSTLLTCIYLDRPVFLHHWQVFFALEVLESASLFAVEPPMPAHIVVFSESAAGQWQQQRKKQHQQAAEAAGLYQNKCLYR